MRKYKVGIDKCYFPQESWSEETSCIQEAVEVLANNRTEAAQKAWQQHGERWLDQMCRGFDPQPIRHPVVSLYVKDATGRAGGLMTRLATIKVYTR
jgi:hypothetical protein